MRNPTGYATISEPDKPLREVDTITCGHCSKIVHVKTGEDAGGLCKICMKLICGPCVGKGTCTPWEKKLEQFEAKERARRSYGI